MKPMARSRAALIRLVIFTSECKIGGLRDGWIQPPIRPLLLVAIVALSGPVPFAGAAEINELAKLVAGDGAEDDQFGYGVSISGSRALVGAPGADGNQINTGAAYLFESDGAAWSQVQRIVANDGRTGDNFGLAVRIDGTRAIVGAPSDDSRGNFAGSAYIFELQQGVWTQVVKLLPLDLGESDQFGWSVAIDGDRALVGSRGDDDRGTGAGAVYVFDFDGTSWGQTAKFGATDARQNAAFGFAVDLELDRAVVGAPFHDVAFTSWAGTAYVFEYDGANWSQTQRLESIASESSGLFGSSVALSGDRVLIGARQEDAGEADSGRGYIFEQTGGTWSRVAVLSSSTPIVGGRMGWSADIEGDRAVLGQVEAGIAGTNVGPGSLIVYEWDGFDWSAVDELVATDGAVVSSEGDRLGWSAGLSGSTVISGALLDDDAGRNSGTAFIFDLNSPPTALDDALVVFEDTLLSGDVVADNGSGPDIDPDGDSLEVQSPGTFTASGIGGTVTTLANGDFTYTPPLNLSGVATFDYTIADPSGATSSATVTITVAPVNDQPSFSAIDPASVLEDAGPQSIANWAAFDPGAPNELQGVSAYTVSNVGVPGLFSSVPSVDGSGTLTFTPADDAFGTSTFDVIVQDDGGVANGGTDTSDPQTFTITIDPVNDAPSFASDGNVTEIEDGDYNEVWAGSISPGPANESGQAVSFMTTVTSNPGLFAVAPSVDPAGTLSFTPVADTTGSATIEVVAMDDGGTDNGGDPASDPATFTIDVFAAADLAIDKTSGSFFTEPGGTISYTIVVSNPGPSDVTMATVTDTPPARLGNVTWTCTPTGGAACTPSGFVEINELVNLPEGSSVTFQLDAELSDTLNEPITNSASVTIPVGVLELEPENNTDSDTDLVGLFADGMEVVEP